MTSITYWIIIFIAHDGITLPVKNNDEFQEIVDHCSKFTQLRSIASFQIVLICFRSIRILTTQFPAFGCLFDTIKASAYDLSTFMLSMVILGLGFVFTACLIFGPNGSEFRNFGKAAEQLFFSAMSQVTYSTFQNSASKVVYATLFFIVFLFLFNFILMKMLITIVILRYRTIRSCKLIEIQARSRVIGEDTKKVRQKWINFILCKKPLRGGNNPLAQAVDNNQQPRTVNMGLWEVIKYNWHEIRKPEPYKSRDEFEHQLVEARDQILKEKQKATKEFQENYSYKRIQNHKDNVLKMCYYLFYIMLFLTVVLMQLVKAKSFSHKVEESILKHTPVVYSSDRNLTFNEITRTKEALVWIDQ